MCTAATALAVMLEEMCKESSLHQLEAKDVHVVSSKTQTAPWQTEFLKACNVGIHNCKVLIATPTLQAGHSIDEGVGKCGV